ncbi:hypothetical protein VCRA2110O318_180084 [Vibrio crassostreae]|nr:hypothetical protein VCRA2117O328_190020 [Vibrio crassostreae]CAK2285289.1 hypothetical protein VCRA2110O318_180084 [Vibrio crassostreae]CAK2427168.1 hypothetical protein VCRA2110O319_190020 [Vibrio crassostreae]CAK2753940.1 hypothetical protein VCRA217O317_200083 [Vibrio crassostreae]
MLLTQFFKFMGEYDVEEKLTICSGISWPDGLCSNTSTRTAGC